MLLLKQLSVGAAAARLRMHALCALGYQHAVTAGLYTCILVYRSSTTHGQATSYCMGIDDQVWPIPHTRVVHTRLSQAFALPRLITYYLVYCNYCDALHQRNNINQQTGGSSKQHSNSSSSMREAENTPPSPHVNSDGRSQSGCLTQFHV